MVDRKAAVQSAVGRRNILKTMAPCTPGEWTEVGMVGVGAPELDKEEARHRVAVAWPPAWPWGCEEWID